MQTSAFFFTELDESLRPKGSRDPIGLEPVWSQVGRRLVGNLTTVTRSLDNFIVTLVGFAIAAQGGSSKDETEPGSSEFYLRFERFEQLAAWGRFAHGRPDVVGTRIIASRDQDRKDGKVAIGAGTAAKILGDQRRSGLWGLYSTALMATGLVDAKRRLKVEGYRIVKPFLYYYYASPAMKTLRMHMDDPARTIHVNPLELDIGPLLESPGRDALAVRLLREGEGPMQKAIYDRMRSPDFGCFDKISTLFTALASDSSANAKLSSYAQNVILLERTLVVVAAAFDFLLGPQSRPLADVMQTFVNSGWDDFSLWNSLTPPEDTFRRLFTGVWQRRVERLYEIVGHLCAGQLAEFIHALLAFHADIMRERGGPAWVQIDSTGAMRGIMGEQRALPQSKTVLASWNNDYFIGAFIALMRNTPAYNDGADRGLAA
ncbi:hypothetical protein AWB81_05848 [Caballeronia arationis]|uniref:hypothetical protein n=1 Tax=Caballeronia arationis TaxID=1777142 RepID=UPI00074C5B64|nr:hypothetical protein [Caballeronia arationis]SAL00143.1 hypothetical protein AWB81_05848 [Caballeronia arationis]